MKPDKKGWLAQYLEYRKGLLLNLISKEKKSSHPEYSLYRIIQPTGLMYGQSVDAIDYPGSNKWTEKERMKILLADSLISSAMLFYDKPIKNEEELNEIIEKTLENISRFYNSVFPEIATASKNIFGKKKTNIELAERIIEKRIDHTAEYNINFWTQFFHNSLLFLDIFIFGQWVHTNADRIVSDFFKYERQELRFAVVKVIAAAAHANTTVEFEERKLIEYFLQSAGLAADKRKEAIQIFEQGIDVENINLPTNNSWILKKYFLEMAILTLWADKKVEEVELLFLKRLSDSLLFNDEDLENSMMAIEGFVLEHWDQLNTLQNKQNYEQVSAAFLRKVSKTIENHKGRLINAIKGNEVLMSLLRKAQSNQLSDIENQLLHDELIIVMKAIPTFSVISLPQRFLTLSILMKILPSTFFAECLKN